MDEPDDTPSLEKDEELGAGLYSCAVNSSVRSTTTL